MSRAIFDGSYTVGGNARVPGLAREARADRRPAGDLGRPSRAQGGARAGARLPLAALHRALPQGLPRPRAQGPARPAGGADPADLPRRLAGGGEGPAARSTGAAGARLAEGGGAAGRRRGRLPRLLRLPAEHWSSSEAPTRSSASTARSAGAPTSSGSSPTTAR